MVQQVVKCTQSRIDLTSNISTISIYPAIVLAALVTMSVLVLALE